MSRPLRVGLSTCPNDTFAFHALLEGRVRAPGLELEFVLADIEELNHLLLAGELDLAKASYPAMLAAGERVWLLPCGSALGFGVGPLLLHSPGREARMPLPARARVLSPGRWTTAAFLLRHLGAFSGEAEPVLFSAILPRLAAGEADYGVCIHEARFTWQRHGVGLVADLGELFEQRTGGPLPLGGLCVRRELGRVTASELARAVRSSLDWALAHREECLPTLQRHARETSEEVLWAHVDLYVNRWTLELGDEGRRAVATLAALANRAELQVLDP